MATATTETDEKLRAQRDEAVALLMRICHSREAILYADVDGKDSREVFVEFVGRHGIVVHQHSLACYDDAGPGRGGVSIVCGKVEGVDYGE